MNTPPKLAFACPMPWTKMTGTERWKYCAQCGHHVTNLSLLSAAERAALLERAKTERICGSYYMRLSGEMVTPEAPLSDRERSGVRQFGVAVLSAAAMALAAGCVSKDGPQPPVATLRAEPVSEAIKPVAQTECAKPDSVAQKKDDEVLLLMGGMFGVEPKPERKPGRSGK